MHNGNEQDILTLLNPSSTENVNSVFQLNFTPVNLQSLNICWSPMNDYQNETNYTTDTSSQSRTKFSLPINQQEHINQLKQKSTVSLNKQKYNYHPYHFNSSSQKQRSSLPNIYSTINHHQNKESEKSLLPTPIETQLDLFDINSTNQNEMNKNNQHHLFEFFSSSSTSSSTSSNSPKQIITDPYHHNQLNHSISTTPLLIHPSISTSSSTSSTSSTSHDHHQLNQEQQDESSIPRKQNLRYEQDAYTPRWVRYTGQLKQGYCDSCQPNGRWLQLKNSAYWYHKQFFHGISSVSGQPFTSPLEKRVNKETDILEGLCHQCLQFVPICNSKRKNSVLWYRHAHKCHIYNKPAKQKQIQSSTSVRNCQ